MQLIMSGNTDMNIIRHVIFFVQKQYESSIRRVFFIDTRETLYQDEVSLESERNDIIRRSVEEVTIESSLTTRAKLHIEIPRLISEHMENHESDDLIIDMTTGDTYTSNILYATASLSKIRNLFFLYMDENKWKEDPASLSEQDYTLEVISPLENLDSIGRNNYFEVTFYQERMNNLLLFSRNVTFESNFLKTMFATQLNTAITHFFEEEYAECIMNIGQIIEEISMELCERIKQAAQGEIREKLPRSFDESITWLRVYFCEPLRAKKNKDLLEYEENLRNLQTLDILIDLIRVYRNCNTHPYDILRARDDARLVMDTALYIMDNINESQVFL